MARVLMIAYTTYVIDGRIKRHVQALSSRGDEVDLICLENPQQGKHNGVNIIGLKIPPYRGSSSVMYVRSYLGFFLKATTKALALERKRHYDVAIVCSMPDAAILCALPLRAFGTKLILDIHDTMPELYADKFRGRIGEIGAYLLRWEERLSAMLAHSVLAVHEPHRKRLVRAGISGEKISVVLNTPDPRIFDDSAQVKNSSRKDLLLVCHGTLAHRLGLDVAVRAVALVCKQIPKVRLLIIGHGDSLNDTRELVTALNLQNQVRFVPTVPIERLPKVLRHASIGLVPNHASSATDLMLPGKLLEYATLGIPIVSARLKTVEHYFDQNAVYFFKPGNPNDLARAILEVTADPGARDEKIRRAKQVMQIIKWENQRERYYEAIDALLAGQSLSNPAASRNRIYTANIHSTNNGSTEAHDSPTKIQSEPTANL